VTLRRLLLSTIVVLIGCGGGDDGVDPRYEEPGPYPVGNTTIVVTDASRNRTLTVEIWYPADESERGAADTGEAVENFVVDSVDRGDYVGLLAAAPAGCPSTQTGSARDAVVASNSGQWPLLVFSHCHNCVRFSSFAIAERLASHGFVVAAPGHIDNTLFDDLAGTAVELDSAFLPVRGADMSFVIDTMLDGSNTDVPANLRGTIDPDRVAVYGHSFGGVTTGLVVQDDARVKAGLAIASPMENPLLEGVLIANITKPIGFLLAMEDNSITELGNLFIRRNFDDATVPVWKAEVTDAGHWSFSNICGVHEQFMPGCGSDTRQTDNTPFDYLPVADGLAISQAYVTAYFSAQLLGDDNADRYLSEPRPGQDAVAIDRRD